MNKIVHKEHFSENVVLLEIEAPLIAKARKAGHFVIIRLEEKGERIPLTIAKADTTKGTITLVVQKVGLSSTKLCNLNEGDYITDVVGPLGKATHIKNFGTVICAGGGVGVAPMLPIIQALKEVLSSLEPVIIKNEELFKSVSFFNCKLLLSLLITQGNKYGFTLAIFGNFSSFGISLIFDCNSVIIPVLPRYSTFRLFKSCKFDTEFKRSCI